MSGNSIWFPGIPQQLNEMYDFVKKVVEDIKNLKHKLSERELKKLLTDLKRGIETINLICLKIEAKYEVAKRTNREMHISPAERRDIESKISALTNELNVIVETAPIREFLGEHPQLAKNAYMKLEAEGVDEMAPEPSEDEAHEKFLQWIHNIIWYTGDLLNEYDEAIKKSFN
jgi:hypothetical protein